MITIAVNVEMEAARESKYHRMKPKASLVSMISMIDASGS